MRAITTQFEPRRNNSHRKVTKKFIIVTEGYRTEQIYFSTLSENKDMAGIVGIVDIIPLQRELQHSGNSHPSSIIDILDRYMNCVTRGCFSNEYLKEIVCQSLYESTSISIDESKMKIFESETDVETKEYWDADGFTNKPLDVLNVYCNKAKEILNVELVVDLQDLIDYRPEIDKVCIVIDRDSDSHSRSDIDDFIIKCKNKNYYPYITNPCFELWLMMHFEAFDSIDKKKLFNNPKINGKRFTEIELDRMMRESPLKCGYSKTKYDSRPFIYRTSEAIDRNMSLCHDINNLKNKLGSNMCELLNEMRSYH